MGNCIVRVSPSKTAIVPVSNTYLCVVRRDLESSLGYDGVTHKCLEHVPSSSQVRTFISARLPVTCSFPDSLPAGADPARAANGSRWRALCM